MKWVEDFRKIKYPAIVTNDVIGGHIERINEKALNRFGEIERIYAIGKGVRIVTASGEEIRGKRVWTEYTSDINSIEEINRIAREVRANFIIVRKSSNQKFATAKIIFCRFP